MRIATWNVNSLKARQEKVEWWLERAAPDVLLMQETKLGDDDAPVMAFAMAGYDLVHHGEGRWNGVAIAVRQGLGAADVVTNFGDGPVRDSGPGRRRRASSEEDFDPFDEARMVSARRRPGRGRRRADPGRQPVRPERPGRRLAVLRRASCAGSSGSRRWLRETRATRRAARPRRRLQHRPDRRRRLGPAARSTAGPTSRSPSGRRSGRCSTGAWSTPTGRAHAEPGRFTWWDYRAGNFHKNLGMRIDHLLVDPAARRPGRLGRDRPRGPQGHADPVGPRPARRRPRRPGPAVRPGLGRRPGPDRRSDATPVADDSALMATLRRRPCPRSLRSR